MLQLSEYVLGLRIPVNTPEFATDGVSKCVGATRKPLQDHRERVRPYAGAPVGCWPRGSGGVEELHRGSQQPLMAKTAVVVDLDSTYRSLRSLMVPHPLRRSPPYRSAGLPPSRVPDLSNNRISGYTPYTRICKTTPWAAPRSGVLEQSSREARRARIRCGGGGADERVCDWGRWRPAASPFIVATAQGSVSDRKEPGRGEGAAVGSGRLGTRPPGSPIPIWA